MLFFDYAVSWVSLAFVQIWGSFVDAATMGVRRNPPGSPCAGTDLTIFVFAIWILFNGSHEENIRNVFVRSAESPVSHDMLEIFETSFQ